MTAKNKQAELKVLKARTSMLLKDPFFGRLALYLKMVEDESIPTMCVDGKHIFYNPQFVLEKCNADSLRGVVAHEIMHCVLEHTLRRGGREPGRWNAACDYAINPIITESGYVIPKGGLVNPAFAGMGAEQIYSLLPEGSGGDGGGSDEHEPLCDVRQSAQSQAEATEQRDNWKVAVSEAATAAHKAGRLPGSLKRLVDDITSPKVDWRAVLREFVTQLSKDDYSWTRPNRRMLALGFLLPGLYSESMGAIDVVIDTSGSISDEVLAAFASEVTAIAAAVRPERVRVIYADATINHIDVFEAGEPLKFSPHGGGGTDFRPIFAQNAEEDHRPAALIYLTDLYGPEPDHAPDYPVLWCCTTDRVGSFGQTVKLEL